jgi:hypothetical protein
MVEWERVLSSTSFLAFSIVAHPQKISCQTAGIIIYCHSVIVLMHSTTGTYCIDLTVTADPFQIHHLKNSTLPCNATQLFRFCLVAFLKTDGCARGHVTVLR